MIWDNRDTIGKLQMIKMFRSFTKLGLVEAKQAVEAWQEVTHCEVLTSVRDMSRFVDFVLAFTDNRVEINPEGKIIWSQKPLTLDEIRTL